MELLEAAEVPQYLKEIEAQCAFSCTAIAHEYDEEDLEDDDNERHLVEEHIYVEHPGPKPCGGTDLARFRKVAETATPMTRITFLTQANNGGKLGRNILEGGCPGKEGTVTYKYRRYGDDKDTEIEYPKYEEPRRDTKATHALITLPAISGTEDMPPGGYPFTVAAHHLIPGNGSLKASELWHYINKTGERGAEAIKMKINVKGKSQERSIKINGNIGYNVNGSHNGVWLPGNYAMNRRNAPEGVKSWNERTDEWKLAYISGVEAHINGQFHDSHSEYNKNIAVNFLNAIERQFYAHIAKCPICINKGDDEFSPSYSLIKVLVKASHYLRQKVSGNPGEWRKPYLTSETA